jgi:hypothetical protein
MIAVLCNEHGRNYPTQGAVLEDSGGIEISILSNSSKGGTSCLSISHLVYM